METVQLFVRSVKQIGKFLCSVEFVIRQHWVYKFLIRLSHYKCSCSLRANYKFARTKNRRRDLRHRFQQQGQSNTVIFNSIIALQMRIFIACELQIRTNKGTNKEGYNKFNNQNVTLSLVTLSLVTLSH